MYPYNPTKAVTLAGLVFLIPMEAIADNWGQNWGSLIWGAGSSPLQAVPVDGMWILVATSVLIAALGAFKMRKK